MWCSALEYIGQDMIQWMNTITRGQDTLRQRCSSTTRGIPAPRTFTNTTAVHASLPSNTFAIYGNGEEKELTELVPGILNQLGPDSLASLRKLAESYQSMQKAQGEDGDKKDDEDDEDIPELVAGQDFESGDKKEEEADVE
jgi:hypothetical protein